MKLLQTHDNRGYPTEYLLSRIKGRRSFLLTDWDPLLFSPSAFEHLLSTRYGESMISSAKEGIWKHMMKEYRWAYLQMNACLQEAFEPFFAYFEVQTLIECLRFKVKGTPGDTAGTILYHSLLSQGIKDVLTVKKDLPAVLQCLEGSPDLFPALFYGLKETFIREGLPGVERHLTRTYLEHMAGSGHHPVIRKFFVHLTDTKNLLALFKHVRWAVGEKPVFIRGGTITESRLAKQAGIGTLPAVVNFIFQYAGVTIPAERANMRVILDASLTKKISGLRKEGSDIGLILDYLWRCFIETRNVNTILCAPRVDRDDLRKELVQ